MEKIGNGSENLHRVEFHQKHPSMIVSKILQLKENWQKILAMIGYVALNAITLVAAFVIDYLVNKEKTSSVSDRVTQDMPIPVQADEGNNDVVSGTEEDEKQESTRVLSPAELAQILKDATDNLAAARAAFTDACTSVDTVFNEWKEIYESYKASEVAKINLSNQIQACDDKNTVELELLAASYKNVRLENQLLHKSQRTKEDDIDEAIKNRFTALANLNKAIDKYHLANPKGATHSIKDMLNELKAVEQRLEENHNKFNDEFFDVFTKEAERAAILSATIIKTNPDSYKAKEALVLLKDIRSRYRGWISEYEQKRKYKCIGC